jgi:hypothetical protein
MLSFRYHQAKKIAAYYEKCASNCQARLDLTEQNERLRFSLEVDLLHKMQDRFNSQLFISKRSAAARYFLDNAFVDDRMVGVERLNEAATDLCEFFEHLAYLQRVRALSATSVWNVFGSAVCIHWKLWKPGVERMREAWQDPTIYEQFEQLARLLEDMNHERGIPDPTPEVLRQGLEEAAMGEEPPTTTE